MVSTNSPFSALRKKLLFSIPDAMPFSACTFPIGNCAAQTCSSSKLTGVKTAIGGGLNLLRLMFSSVRTEN